MLQRTYTCYASNLPAAGALLKGEDNGEKQLTLEV